MTLRRILTAVLLTGALAALAVLNFSAQEEPKSLSTSTKEFIPPGPRIYGAPMRDGFDTFIIAGIMKKKGPPLVVASRKKADHEVTGIAESEKAGLAKMLFKDNSAHGKKSTAEACAKHLKKLSGA